MGATIDPTSAVPLYHQIAEAIRARIARGELQAGDVLTPLGEAAEAWGVNLHTVRHAYTALTRDGLIETRRGPRGTRVAGGTLESPIRTPMDPDGFLDDIIRTAREQFGWRPDNLVQMIHERALVRATRFTIHVVECSLLQATAHAAEITERWAVDARPRAFEHGEPPEGPIVATYFHYNDIRRLWPHRMADVAFVTIQPRAETLDQLPRETSIVWVAEKDIDTARAVAGDLSVLGAPVAVRVEPKLLADIMRELDEPGPPVFIPPRVWAGVPDSVRRKERVKELQYVFDRRELAAFARKSGWVGTEHPAATTST